MTDHPVAVAQLSRAQASDLRGPGFRNLRLRRPRFSRCQCMERYYWAQKGTVKLAMYASGPGRPWPEKHRDRFCSWFTASNSAQSATTSPCRQRRLFNDERVRRLRLRRLDIDHDGYGKFRQLGNSSDIASGVEDIKAAFPVVMKENRAGEDARLRHSSGAIRAGAYAKSSRKLDRLVLSAFTTRATARKRSSAGKAHRELRSNRARKRDAAMIRSIFTATAIRVLRSAVRRRSSRWR